MPGKVGVKIKAGRNLPVMDRGSDTTDAYVEIKLGNVTHKTDVCRKTLNPQWNTDWFRFEVDDAELQDEPLQIRLMDHDTYSANDAIGKVNISLNPLCLENAGQSNQGKGAVMSGWIPVFDTMHGIRGEVNIIVKVDLFSDANKFRQSSCGVQFFHSPCIPHGYRAQVIHGFVEELVVNDDPEYQWIDKIRTPRASNEARQVVFLTLSGQVQRKIGLKAINLGANAVIGYTQCFDLEGDVGVVVRGIGTAVTLVKIQESINQPVIDSALIEERTLNYLKFLSGNSNDLDDLTKSIFDTDYMDLDPNNVVYKILGIEPIDKCSARSPNIIVKRKWKPNIKDGVIYEESFNENDGMRQLLEQEDRRGEKPNRKFHHHVKRITTSSKTLLNEKFNAFKARLNDDKLSSENDSKSLNSSWSDISFTETARSSLTDLRNLMRFKKATNKYNRSVSDGSAMATLLVSSVMYGRDTSLESISEAHDSARSSPSLPRIRTDSKSESMSNLLSSSCEDKAPITKLGKDMKSESMNDLMPQTKLKTDNKYLSPKMSTRVTKLNSSMSTISGSSSSSSDDNDEDDDDEEDDDECSDEEECSEITTNEVLVVDPDTVSMVVKSVLAKCLQEDSDNWIQPGSTLVNDDNNLANNGNNLNKADQNLEKILMTKSLSFGKRPSIDTEDKNNLIEPNAVTFTSNQQFIQTGGTRILKKDKNAHITESKIMETNASAAILGTMLKQPSIDEDVDNWIEPGSTADEPETIDKGRRQSLLHDLKENISGKFHHLQEHIHLPHFTDHSKILHKHGLLDTAMETMLIEKANILGAEQPLLATTLTGDNENTEIIHKIPKEPYPLDEIKYHKQHDSLDFIAKTLHLPFGHGHKVIHQQKHKNEIRNDSGLLGNAMRAMLMEPFNFAEEICHDETMQSPLRTTPLELPITEIVTDTKDNKLVEENEEISIIKNIENPLAIEKDFKELDLPIKPISCNLQQQTIIDQELGNFYSSEPELNQINDNMLSPINYDNQPAPFLSLTNLNVLIIKKSNENCENDNNNNINNCSSLIRNQLTPIINTNSFVLPKAIIIHPSTPLTTPETPLKSFSFDDINPNEIHNDIITTKSNAGVITTSSIETNQNENNNQKVDVIIKKTIYLVDNNKNLNNNNKNAKKNNKKNKNYINNKKSSSYTNLSCTNKAPMLTPFPSNLKRQLRSSTELVASGSTSPATTILGQPTTTTASTQATMSAISLTMNMTEQQHLTPNQQQGHNRAESVGGGTNKNVSPAKVSNIGTSATTGTSSGNNNNAIPTNNKNQEIYRRSSDSDLSVTPKGNSICVASDRLVAATTMMRLSAPTSLKNTNPDNLDMLEYPFLTMCKYPTGFILHLGATVAARSVKLLERVPNPDEPETRDSWWTELRMEIRSHARALGCNVILGYSEVTTISDDVCVLSATGTAAVINMSYSGEAASHNDFTTTSAAATISSSKKDLMVSSLDERECLRDGVRNNPLSKENGSDLNYVTKEFSSSFGGTTKTFPSNFLQNKGCAMCHIPYSTAAVPFNIRMKKCAVCKRGKVPDVLLATIEIPECLHITGRGCFMQAQVVRAKKDLRAESNAKEISDGLPFLEYELHRVLINKLKAKGMNAIFGLKAHVAIGEKMMALIATGTAVFLTALPPPSVPKIVAGNSWHDTARLNDLQKSLQETVERNREIYQLKNMESDYQNGGSKQQSDTDDSDEELLEMDLNAGNKDTCVLEVDDIEDLEIISLLMEPCPPEGFHVVNTQSVPGLQDMEVVRNLQMFTQIWRAKLSVGSNNERFPKHFQRLLQTIYFKLRTMIPCAICDLKFRLDLPESDEIQILVTGMALGLGEPSKLSKIRRKTISNNQSNELQSNLITNGSSYKKLQDDDLIFSLDEDQNTETAQFIQTVTGLTNLNYGTHSLKLKKNSPSRPKFTPTVKYSRHLPLHDRYGVDITPLSYVPGGKIEKYLGNLNFFFIRESTSIRENGGISGFVHSFITEILAVVRAHISALGGNAMVSFYMTELLLVDNQHKNQGQCLLNIGGDVVFVSYYADD